ncbi:hypothetical protein R6K88_04355, partial [Enterococcus faecium]|uniref:hypothetical protein n=1 Tax=Enterococcus faecium TaxID=1352 RepID=UPI00296AD363
RCLFYMFWKIKKMLVSSTNIKKYRAKINNVSKAGVACKRATPVFLFFFKKTFSSVRIDKNRA